MLKYMKEYVNTPANICETLRNNAEICVIYMAGASLTQSGRGWEVCKNL